MTCQRHDAGPSRRRGRLAFLGVCGLLAALCVLACGPAGTGASSRALTQGAAAPLPATYTSPPPQTATEAAPLQAARAGRGINVKGVNYDDDSLDKAIALDFAWIKIYDHPPPERLPFKVLYRVGLPLPGEDWAEWGHYRHLDAALYADRIDAYEIGNEPNLREEWGGDPDPAAYARLLEIAYHEIKSADPDALVVSAGLAPVQRGSEPAYLHDLDYLRAMYEAGAAPYFDVLGLHPYGFSYPPEIPVDGTVCPTPDPYAGPTIDRGCWQLEGTCFRRAELAREIMVAYGDADKPAWATEFGWVIRPPACCLARSDWHAWAWHAVSRGEQARYIVRAFDYAETHWPWMEVMFLWNLDYSRYPEEMDEQCPHCDSMGWFSILDPDGTPRRSYDWLQGDLR
ncbi:MAG: hypothetical protein JXA09_13475 [Anaerolineae bacterium]|nr:hypothetical protein [Anaerolineae bacterium]